MELSERRRMEDGQLGYDPAWADWNEARDSEDTDAMEISAMSNESYISDTGGSKKDFAQCPQGTHVAVCHQIINLGEQKREWDGEISYRNQHFINFQIPSQRIKYKDKDDVEQEGPITIAGFYTSSLNEKAKLRKHLEGWRGKSFTDDELKAFNLGSILGKPCLLSVTHSDKGKARIGAIMSLPEGTPAPEAEGEAFVYDPRTSPESWNLVSAGLQRMCKAGGTAPAEESSQEERENPAEFDDEIPF